jgi:hypothetical protein
VGVLKEYAFSECYLIARVVNEIGSGSGWSRVIEKVPLCE